MRVVHVIGCPLHSGAGRGVLALHKALLKRGIDSQIIGRVENNLPPKLKVESISLIKRLPASIAIRFQRWWLKRRFRTSLRNFQLISHGVNLNKEDTYRKADIIHIQYAEATTLGRSFWRMLDKENRPIIWTLRDMWTFTGGCHFSGTCDRFLSACGNCPQLGGGGETVTSETLNFKAVHITNNITFVGISNIIADAARRSTVLNECDIRIISNSVMLDRFKILNKYEARNALGLPKDKFILATGALNIADQRKGSDTLAATLEVYRNNDNVHWVIFGEGLDELTKSTPENCTSLGLLSDDTTLNQIYSAADVFLMPSLQESFGKTTIEAMVSGTVVIAYDNTPAVDMIQESETGWLVPHGNIEAYITVIEHAREMGFKALLGMGNRANEDIRTRFSLDNVVQKHIDLYQERLDNQSTVCEIV